LTGTLLASKVTEKMRKYGGDLVTSESEFELQMLVHEF